MQTIGPFKSAWLITWEWAGDHAKVPEDKKVVAILNYRRSGRHVREYVEQLYVALSHSAWDKLGIAQNPKSIPYPAEFMRIDGVQWEREIRCGHNPWLQARMVRNIQVTIHYDGQQETTWDEIPIPKSPQP